jgi:electron transport complex protein RnfB
MMPPVKPQAVNRLDFFKQGLGRLASMALGLVSGFTLFGSQRKNTVWQINPMKCVHCEHCATSCVLTPSAVKCVQSYPMCGYCRLCFGYFQPNAPELSTGAENQLCPTNAIERLFIEEPYYEYNILEEHCIGCAKCVKACEMFGNASFYLQVRHNICVNCNDCSIARQCPADAWERVPAEQAYKLKHTQHASLRIQPPGLIALARYGGTEFSA